MDLLLKWSPELEDDTCDQHRAAAASMGSTWWGCYSIDDNRHIARDRLALIERQLADRVPTTAFVYRLGPDTEVWRTRVVGVEEDDSLIDRTHRPKGMSFDGCFLFVELADFESIDPGWPEQRLALWDKPGDGSLHWSSLHNQTSPMYVFELSGSDDGR